MHNVHVWYKGDTYFNTVNYAGLLDGMWNAVPSMLQCANDHV